MHSHSILRDSQAARTLTWFFPLERPHCGIALGNGTQGVLIWGDSALYLTVARAGFWDRRGGNPFASKVNFARVRELLEAGDEPGLRAAFAEPDKGPGVPNRPQQIGGARLEISFLGDFSPVKGELFLDSGRVEVTLENPQGEARVLALQQHSDAELCWIEGAEDAQVRVRPSWEWVGDQLSGWGFEPPQNIEIEDGGGFIQDVPENEALALVWRKRAGVIMIATALDGDPEAAAKAAVTTARAFPDTDSKFFWQRYWADVPSVQLPDERLQKFWELALYKQAGLTTPGAVAATLQGPWMEEYQLPPWSNDYHFNINVQLIYYPALMTNRAEHFAPLWEMIKGWMPTLRATGEAFFGQPGAMMLPHAVDDQCHVVGSFWAGTIDHACTAWVAQMAWLHYRYFGDQSVLREVAWPLLNGAFEGFWAMHEERDGQFSLPVTVSPEYRGDQVNAWGRDASFQLAAWGMVSQILPQAAEQLGQPLDARWQEVMEKLPAYSLVNSRIGLWEGLELEESHRHHAHLAGIWPFMSFDPLVPEHYSTVADSIHFWNFKGAGLWTGWCLPWASILCSRLDLPDAALAWLGWLDHFANAGFGTRHNADFAGFAAWDNGELERRRTGEAENEVMQMDATMGLLIAVCELLVQNRRGVIHVLPKIPRRWRELEFDRLRAEGAFLIGATVRKGRVQQVRVQSENGGRLRLVIGQSEVIEREMGSGEVAVFDLTN